jgi:hypothetical protein
METTPARVGAMLFSLVEPYPGLHRTFNRWYERDHFYAGVMTLAGSLSGARWVATRDLKARRYPDPSPIVPEPGKGSFLHAYYIDAERFDEWDRASVDVVLQHLLPAGRMFPRREHVLTKLFDLDHASYRDADPVPALLTLDHRYAGLVTVVGRGADGVSRDEVDAWMRDVLLPERLDGSPVASVLTFTPRPFTGERPADLVVEPDPPTRFLQLWFVERDPGQVWDDVFQPLGPAIDRSGIAVTEWVGGFVPAVPGTDTHVDDLEV